ncbi:MAG: SDR family NAD(P)-dependent oxidoreductase [Bacteroidales bacterium]|nr:SDR family NAD(P)-dependent oxidoreductase [Bacteroidales bacterium]
MNSNARQYALVTGASRGLGKSIALELARRNIPTILVGTNERVRAVCDEIVTTYHVPSECYITDLTKKKNVLAMAEAINCQFEVFMLINNAGVGGTKRFEDADISYLENIINLNVRCTTLLIHELLPNLKRQSKSYILNVGSMAALTPTGYKTVYPASKSFVYSFSLGLREELKKTSISVSVALPGAMATNPDVVERIARQGFFGKATLKSTQSVAQKCVRQTLRGKRKIVINPLSQFLSAIVPERCRTRMLSKIVRREICGW